MAKQDFPAWVLKYKKKGIEIRQIKGHFYAYEVSSQWNKQTKRSRKITGKYLGKVTPQGIVAPAKQQIKAASGELVIKPFGDINYLLDRNLDIMQVLEKDFPTFGLTLFVAAITRLLYQSPIKNMLHHYKASYLSIISPQITMNDKALSEVLGIVGSLRKNILTFFEQFYQGSRFILIDATSIHSNSSLEQLSQIGYNSQKDYHAQINAIFASDNQLPLYYRIVPGDIREISAMKICILESGLQNVIIVSDKGFFSLSNVKSLLQEQLYFAIPLKRNNKAIDYKAVKAVKAVKAGDKQTFDGHFFYQQRPIWYHKQLKSIGKHQCYIYLFFDQYLYAQEQKDFLLRVHKGHAKYNMSVFNTKQHTFGTIALMTFLPIDTQAQQAFEYFKSRNEVETMIDTFKNILHADRTYMRTAHQLEGWMFINHIALIMYYRLYKELLNLDLLKKYSVMDILLFLSRAYKVKIGQEWHTAEIPKTTKVIFDKLKIPIT